MVHKINVMVDYCHSVFRLLSQNATGRVGYKPRTCLSHSSGGWGSEIKGLADWDLVKIHFPVPTWRLLTVSP